MNAKEPEFTCRRMYCEGLPMFDFLYELTDKKTGVSYIVYARGSESASITPRINADGTLTVDDSSVTGGQ